MMKTIDKPRAELKPHVPRIEQMTIPKEFIGAVIGPGGKIIQGMQEETGATITIDEEDGVGKIQVSGPNKETIDAAMAKIKAIVAIPEVGEVYEGTVRSIMPYGCFVEFMPGKDGLLHLSEIDWKRLETVEEAGIKEGDKSRIQVFEGTVIAKKHGGIHETFTVRRVAYGCGMERVFPLHSPVVDKVEVIRRGKVRRAKLYYLRDRVGKAAKVKEQIG